MQCEKQSTPSTFHALEATQTSLSKVEFGIATPSLCGDEKRISSHVATEVFYQNESRVYSVEIHAR